jgi:hypothetical protein
MLDVTATQEPTAKELSFEKFIEAYKNIKPTVAKLTIDDDLFLRIVDLKGNEMQVFEMRTQDGIQQFFDLANEVFAQ